MAHPPVERRQSMGGLWHISPLPRCRFVFQIRDCPSISHWSFRFAHVCQYIESPFFHAIWCWLCFREKCRIARSKTQLFRFPRSSVPLAIDLFPCPGSGQKYRCWFPLHLHIRNGWIRATGLPNPGWYPWFLQPTWNVLYVNCPIIHNWEPWFQKWQNPLRFLRNISSQLAPNPKRSFVLPASFCNLWLSNLKGSLKFSTKIDQRTKTFHGQQQFRLIFEKNKWKDCCNSSQRFWLIQ